MNKSSSPLNSALPPTEVCITIDTEFSLGGYFEAPESRQPIAEPLVYGRVGNREEALGFLLETLNRYDISATFFVECANYFYFGDEPMKTVVKRLQEAGQDIQLHVHPAWLSFIEGENAYSFPRNDFCTGRNFEELKQAFALCSEVFERWVGKRPLAIRTGGLCADMNVYNAMRELRIPLASNVALGGNVPDEPELHLRSGRHFLKGVMEIPVFTYQDMKIAGRKRLKSLQITSCSWPEMTHVLWAARRSGVETVVIFTHPQEFIKKTDFYYRKLRRNRVNQSRFRKLCSFINQHQDDFIARDFTSGAQHWLEAESKEISLAIPPYYAVGRKLHNRLNDMIWYY